MFNSLLNKLFNRDRGAKPDKSAPTAGEKAPTPPAKSAPASVPVQRNRDIPNRFEEGLALKAVPENLKGKPKAWDVEIIRIDPGIKEEILVGPPIKTLQEENQLRNIGARKHLRISFRLPAEIRKVHGTELGPPASAHTRDISMSGLALESTANFQKGEEIEIRILSWNFPLNVRATVARISGIEGKNTVAVSFPPDLSTISSDLISQFILENQRR